MASNKKKKLNLTISDSFEKKFYKTKVGKVSLRLEIISCILIIASFIIDPVLDWCKVDITNTYLPFISDVALYAGVTLGLMYLSIYFTARNYDGPRK